MLFWINTDNFHKKTIMCASMNGDNVRTLVNSSLDSPGGLAVDNYMNNRLFWTDLRTHTVETINYIDGSDRYKLEHPGLEHPFKLDLFENNIYFINRENGSIGKIDKFMRGSVSNLAYDLDLTQDLKIFHPNQKPKSNLYFVLFKKKRSFF